MWRGLVAGSMGLCLASLMGCRGADPSTIASEPVSPAAMLPKFRLPWERKVPGKADQYDDYRLAHPEWYAITKPPSVAGFRAHTQWEQSQVFLIPYRTDLPAAIRQTIVDIVVAALPAIDVLVAVPSASAEAALVSALKAQGVSQDLLDDRLHSYVVALDSIWLIDYGPVPLVRGSDGAIAFADFRYYHPRVYDDAFPTKVGWFFGTETYRAPMDWEGGNFQGDGEGTCYTSQGTLWENPGYTWEEIRRILKDYLACEQLVVLKPLVGEGTTHIDMFLKLGGRDLSVLGLYRPAQDATNAKVTAENKAILEGVRLLDGTPMRVVTIPMPDNKGTFEKVWRTYANSAFANGVNLVPVYSINKDLEAQAMDGWRAAMPDFVHVPILSDEIITWGGAVDCITRQVPVGPFAPWNEPGSCQDGQCVAGGEGAHDGPCASDAECMSPAWVCPCNDCSGACGGTPPECGDITFEGCCEPDGTLLYCEDGLRSLECGSYDQCGWNPQGRFYDCDYGAEGPAGFPKACPGPGLPDEVVTPDEAEPDVGPGEDPGMVEAEDPDDRAAGPEDAPDVTTSEDGPGAEVGGSEGPGEDVSSSLEPDLSGAVPDPGPSDPGAAGEDLSPEIGGSPTGRGAGGGCASGAAGSLGLAIWMLGMAGMALVAGSRRRRGSRRGG